MRGRSVTVRAAAKANLSLQVGPVRTDGYHPLVTVYQALGLYDDVTATAAADWTVSVAPTGDLEVSGVPLDETNLAVRAGLLLTEHHGLDRAAALTVHKGIPVAGGLAGGSADAAAALVALDRLWDLQTPDDALLELAARLGSDVPFALLGGTALGRGRGEEVTPVRDEGAWWWVVLPDDEGLSTPAVYTELDRLAPPGMSEDLPQPDDLLGALAAGEPGRLAAWLANDLEGPVLSLRPELGATREALAATGAEPLLSGSGPTWLGLCGDREDARRTAEELRRAGHHTLLATAPVAGAHVVELDT